MTGIERADSLVLDPHKWLFQPYEIGAVLVRRPGLLEQTFSFIIIRSTQRLGDQIDVLPLFQREHLARLKGEPPINRQLDLVDVATDDPPCVSIAREVKSRHGANVALHG